MRLYENLQKRTKKELAELRNKVVVNIDLTKEEIAENVRRIDAMLSPHDKFDIIHQQIKEGQTEMNDFN